jgi:AcrR family transcriptional regulator
VAEKAGVSERTVYRHFASEQELHRAVMLRLEEEAGVTYEGLRLEELADITTRIFASRLSFSAAMYVAEPPFAEEDRHRQGALLDAVLPLTSDWSDTERRMASGMLDVIWAMPSYERLITRWNLPPLDATEAATWVIGLVQEAIQDGRRPGGPRGAGQDGLPPKRSSARVKVAKPGVAQ